MTVLINFLSKDVHKPDHDAVQILCCDDETKHVLFMSKTDKEFAGLSKLQLFKGDCLIAVFLSIWILFWLFNLRLVTQIMSREMAGLSVTNELDNILKKKSLSDLREY